MNCDGNSRVDRLLDLASTYHIYGEPIPVDLAAQMIEAGIDVGAIEGYETNEEE